MSTSTTVEPRTAKQLLAWAHASVEPELRRTVDSLAATIRHLVGQHQGWWDATGTPTPAAGRGKFLRPAVVLLSCQAAGGDPELAIPAAVAVELLHSGSLLHDDVIDRDDTRHGRPTLWTTLGPSAAILTGTSMFYLALQTLRSAGEPLATRGVDLLLGALQTGLDGGYTETVLDSASNTTVEHVIEVSAAKTGALLSVSCALGAMAAGADPRRVERYYAFGRRLGIVFQNTDDLLGIWGDPAVTGKPAGSDLRNRRRTLPVTAALTSDHPAGRELAVLYQKELDEAAADKATVLVEAAGGRALTEEETRRQVQAALGDLDAAEAATKPCGDLATLLDFAVLRDH
ncbi:geranylgeranyl diphosphate synthase type I [Streptomyces canus]|nr:geranylgeranyl diphosphate synthase type I [Streptomyces canus]